MFSTFVSKRCLSKYSFDVQEIMSNANAIRRLQQAYKGHRPSNNFSSVPSAFGNDYEKICIKPPRCKYA